MISKFVHDLKVTRNIILSHYQALPQKSYRYWYSQPPVQVVAFPDPSTERKESSCSITPSMKLTRLCLVIPSTL